MTGARQLAKQATERILRLAAGKPGRMAGRALILAYHNVVPDAGGLGDRGLHLPLTSFCRQADLLERFFEVRELESLLTEGPRGTRPNVAITFDDAYLGAVELGLPELARRGLPCTLFVAPGLLGEPAFWWDELSGPEGLSPAVRQEALERLAGRRESIRQRFGRGVRGTPLPRHCGCASEADLRGLALEGLRFGGHSWSHPNLARLPQDELEAELIRPMDWLRTSGLPPSRVVAYPYGFFSPAVEAAAARAGYLAGLRVEGGWLPVAQERPWSLPRYNVPAGISDDGFLLRLSGWLTN